METADYYEGIWNMVEDGTINEAYLDEMAEGLLEELDEDDRLDDPEALNKMKRAVRLALLLEPQSHMSWEAHGQDTDDRHLLVNFYYALEEKDNSEILGNRFKR